MEILSEEPTEDQKPNLHTTARAISTGVEPAKLNPPPFSHFPLYGDEALIPVTVFSVVIAVPLLALALRPQPDSCLQNAAAAIVGSRRADD
jgi:hypothetical protein